MDIPTLTTQLSSLAAGGPTAIPEDQRLALLNACYSLSNVIENPVEKIMRVMFTGLDSAMLRIAVDLNLFDIVIAKKGPITVDELASATKAEATLIRRVARVLGHLNLLTPVAIDTYVPTPIAGAYTDATPFKHTITHLHTTASAASGLPEYFESQGYKNPSDAYDGPWQFTHEKGETAFEWTSKRPRYQHSFNMHMGMQKLARKKEWFEDIPLAEKLKVDDPERLAYVDIGGNTGHDIKLFYDRFKSLGLQGKVALVDLPSVVDAATDFPPEILRVGHDFFKPYPPTVHNAKAYYLRMVLHDWPDKQARIILSHIRSIMAPDSILLLGEVMLPDEGVTLFETHLDLLMMSFAGSLERTHRQWKALLEETGFEIVDTCDIEDGITKLKLIESVGRK